MATLVWRGDAQGRAQVTHVTPDLVEIGDVFTLTVNRKDVSFTATAPTVANVVSGLVAAWNAQTAAEFDEVTASAGVTGGAITHVVLTGPADGKPFTVSSSTTDAGNLGVTVTTLTAGAGEVNEQELITLPGPPTGGTFTLTFDGQTTGAIAYNASAATVDAALTALSNIGATDVAVTGNAGGPWTVEFTSALAATNVPLLTGSGSSLTGGATVTVATTTQGTSGTNEVQRHTLSESVPGVWTIGFGGTYFTPSLSTSATAAEVQTALEALPNIGAGNISVARTGSAPNFVYTLTFINALGNQNVALTTGPAGDTVETVTQGSSSGTNEVQAVTVNNAPTGGTFTLTFSGQTTSAQPFNESAANVQADLEALSSIGAGNISVARSGSGTLASPYVYTCTFQGTLANTDVSQLTANASSLTGGAVGIATVQEAVAGNNEVQQVELTGGPQAGNFTLTWNPGGGAETTANIAYDASAAAVQSALEGLATPAPGDFRLTGPSGGPWLVEFMGAYSQTDVAAMSGANVDLTAGGTQTLTVSASVSPTGPNWWNEPENWTTGNNPANGDDVWFQLSDVDCLYGLDQLSGVTLASLHVAQSFSGKIGLAVHTGLYCEYRPTYLRVGATSVTIGEGEGAGSGRIKLDCGTAQTNLVLVAGGTPEDGSLPAVLWKGSHASNAARVFKGSLGVAALAGETATLATLQVGTRGDLEGDAEVFCGTGLAITTIEKSGGRLELNSAVTTISQVAGQLVVSGAGGVSNLAIRGGTCFYNSTGTLGGNPVVSGDGVLDFSQDLRAKTVTNPIEVYGDEARVRDPFKVVSSLVIDGNEIRGDLSQFEIGPNIRLTRGTPA